MNTISGLKIIIDAVYAEMNEQREKSEKRIKELEAEVLRLTKLKGQHRAAPIVVDIDDSDEDDAFAEVALAPPASSPGAVLAQVEIKNETIENNSAREEDDKDVKNVRMIAGRDAKEYMKEYQRTYRKKQKEKMINKVNA